jgi:predicted DNA-binding protein
MDKVTCKQPRNVRLDEHTIERLKKIAQSHGISASDLVRNAIEEKLQVWEVRGVTLTRIAS